MPRKSKWLWDKTRKSWLCSWAESVGVSRSEGCGWGLLPLHQTCLSKVHTLTVFRKSHGQKRPTQPFPSARSFPDSANQQGTVPSSPISSLQAILIHSCLCLHLLFPGGLADILGYKAGSPTPCPFTWPVTVLGAAGVSAFSVFSTT